MSTPELVGILLAAGRGRRFDPQGEQDKLLQALPDGAGVALTAARHLLAVLPVVAVVRADNLQLARQLQEAGCEVTLCANADDGMAVSLVHALSHAADARGWVIALADMPYVQPATIRLLADAIIAGAQIAAPTCRGERGNPVAFDRVHLPELLRLQGDEGARRLLKNHPVTEVACDDPGIRQDIDTPADLLAGGVTAAALVIGKK